MLLPAMLSEYNQIKSVLLGRGPSEQSLKELDNIYMQTGGELTPEQISDIPKLLPVVFKSALEEDENVQKVALSILTKLAKSLEQNQYLKTGDSWSEIKECVMKSLPKLTSFLENGVKVWCELWCIIVNLHGSQLISDTTNINSLLKIVERAFKMKGDQVRLVGFTCWNSLIDNFALVAPETNSRYLNLILIPLKALNHGNKVLCRAKLETWKHLMKQIEHNDANIKQALPSFLQFLFEEIGTLAPACHHFQEEAAQCFLDIVKRPNMFRILPDKCVKYASNCIVSILSNSSQVQRVWNCILDGLKNLLWPDDITMELINTLKELKYKISDQSVFAHIVITTLNGTSAMPVRVQNRHFETLIMFVLTAECLQIINENELINFLDILRSTNQVHINLFKAMLDNLISISNRKLTSSSKESENASILKSMRCVWLALVSTVTDWFTNGGNLSQNDDKVAEEVNFIHMLLMCGCTYLSSKWNKRMLKHWKELYSESYKNFILHPMIKQNQIIVDIVNLLLTGLQSDKISLTVAIDVASVLLEIHHSADAENLMPYLLEIVESSIKLLRDDIPSGMSVINQYLSVLLNTAISYHSLVPQIASVTEKMSNFKQDLPALNMRIYNKIMKVHLQVLGMKQPDKSEVRPSSPTVTSFMHRLAKAKQNLSQKMMVSPLRERSLTPQMTTPSPPTKSPHQRQPKIDGDSQNFVMIPPKPRTTPLTERQKEQLFSRPHNIPALYQDLSQDTQSQSNSFEGLISSFEIKKSSGHFLSPVRQLETDTSKSDGMPESAKNLTKIVNKSSDESFAIGKTNETFNLDKSEVVFDEENKDVSEAKIISVESNTTQSTEIAVDNKNLDKVNNSIESKDLLARKRKSEQNLRVKDSNKNTHNTKDDFALNRTSESSSSDNIRITRSASKPKSMRRSISLPIMGVHSDTQSLRKSDIKVSKDTNEKTPKSRKRKHEEKDSSVEPRSSHKKERPSRNNLNVSVSERRVTRQFSESISKLNDEGNIIDVQKNRDSNQKNANGIINDISTEKHDGTVRSKRCRSTRKSTVNSNVTVKKTEELVSIEAADLGVKAAGVNRSAEENKNVNLLSDSCNNKETPSGPVVNENIMSDKIEASSKKLCASNEENCLNIECKHQSETSRLKECEDKNIESSEESRAKPAVTGKDDVNLENTEKVPVKPIGKNKRKSVTSAGNVKENCTDSVHEQSEDHCEENKKKPSNVEEMLGEYTIRIRPSVVTVDQCDDELYSFDQNNLQMEKIDGNPNVESVKKELTGSSVKKLCENEKKLFILLEKIDTDKNETIDTNDLESNKCDKINNQNIQCTLKEVASDGSDVVKQSSENEIKKNSNELLYNGMISKELKVLLERSPVKQGTTYIASKLASPIKIRKLNISGDLITVTPKTSCDSPQKNKTTIQPALVEVSITTKVLGDSPQKNKITTGATPQEESTAKISCDSLQNEVIVEENTTSEVSSDSPHQNKVTTESIVVEESTTPKMSFLCLDGNKIFTDSTVVEDSITQKMSCDNPHKTNITTGTIVEEIITPKILTVSSHENKTSASPTVVKDSTSPKVSGDSPHEDKIITEPVVVEESITPKISSDSSQKQKYKISTESIVDDNSKWIAKLNAEEAMTNDFKLCVEEADNIHKTFIENQNENTETGKKTDSIDLYSEPSHMITYDIYKQVFGGSMNKSETPKTQEVSESKNQKCEEAYKKSKVTHRKNAENLLSPIYNKKSGDPKKQTTLTTLNKWILRTPTKKLSSDDAANINPIEIDTSKDSKTESQDMLGSQDVVESSQELMPEEVNNCNIILHKLRNNCEQETDVKANSSIILQNLLSNGEPVAGTKANCVVLDKHEQETDNRRKTGVSCSSPVRTVVSLTPLQESCKNVNHIQKCTPTKKSVCRRLDKEIEDMHKINSMEQTEKENCIGSCKCKYTNKLETLPINPAFQVDTSSICDDISKPSSQQFVDSHVTDIVCNLELQQRKPDINLDDDETDDDDIFDIKRPRKTIDPDIMSVYFVGRPRTRSFIESSSGSVIKNESPVQRRSFSIKENGSPLCKTAGETNENGSPVSRKLESPTKNGSPPNSRIFKNEIQVSPRSRTAHLIELAKQDSTGIRNFYSPVKLGSGKVRRIRPTRVLGNELTDVDIGGAREDWVCHTYSPLASPNTGILKRKMCETPDIITPNTKRKRVSFCDPPVSESLVFSNNEPGRGQIQRPEQNKGLNGYIEVDSSEIQECSSDSIFPSLELCRHPVTKVLEKFISSHWLDQMETSLEKINVHTVGDFSTMSEGAVYRLMSSSFKLEMLKQALQEYYDSISSEDFPHSTKPTLLNTEFIDNDLQGIAALPSESPESKQIKFTELREETSEQNYDKLRADNIVSEIEKNPDIADDLGNKLDIDIIMKMLTSAVNKLKHSHL